MSHAKKAIFALAFAFALVALPCASYAGEADGADAAVEAAETFELSQDAQDAQADVSDAVSEDEADTPDLDVGGEHEAGSAGAGTVGAETEDVDAAPDEGFAADVDAETAEGAAASSGAEEAPAAKDPGKEAHASDDASDAGVAGSGADATGSKDAAPDGEDADAAGEDATAQEEAYVPARTIADGEYAIISASDEYQVLDVVAASKTPGANVTSYFNCNDSNQKFTITYLSSGYYTIRAVHSGQALDVVAFGTANGTNVTQWSYTGADNQLWEIIDAGGGWYRIRSKCSGLYLDIEGGYAGNSVNVRTWELTTNNSGKGQLFRFARMIEDGYYKIASFDNAAYVIDVVASSVKDGGNVTLWQDRGSDNQIFQIYHMYGEYYKIVNVNSWKALDVVAGGKSNGTNVTQWAQYDTPNQAWLGEVSADGSVRFISKVSGLCLDVEGGHAGNSVNIQTWEETSNNSGRGQRFELTRVSYTPMTAVQKAMLNRISGYSSSTGYLIAVDCTNNKVGVFTGSAGNWSYAYYWSCVTGAPSTPTIKGSYVTSGYKKTHLSTDARARWCTQISGAYYFHTILASESELGRNLSHGCVRLAVSSAQWIYNNIRQGTKIVIYS